MIPYVTLFNNYTPPYEEIITSSSVTINNTLDSATTSAIAGRAWAYADFYTFTIDKPQSININVSGGSLVYGTTPGSYVSIFNASNTLLQKNINNSTIALAAGTYTIELSTYYNSTIYSNKNYSFNFSSTGIANGTWLPIVNPANYNSLSTQLSAGTYTIEVTSQDPNKTGLYDLTVVAPANIQGDWINPNMPLLERGTGYLERIDFRDVQNITFESFILDGKNITGVDATPIIENMDFSQVVASDDWFVNSYNNTELDINIGERYVLDASDFIISDENLDGLEFTLNTSQAYYVYDILGIGRTGDYKESIEIEKFNESTQIWEKYSPIGDHYQDGSDGLRRYIYDYEINFTYSDLVKGYVSITYHDDNVGVEPWNGDHRVHLSVTDGHSSTRSQILFNVDYANVYQYAHESIRVYGQVEPIYTGLDTQITNKKDHFIIDSTLSGTILKGGYGDDAYLFSENLIGTAIIDDISGFADFIDLGYSSITNATFYKEEGDLISGDDSVIDLGTEGKLTIKNYFKQSTYVEGIGYIEEIDFYDMQNLDLNQIVYLMVLGWA